MTSPISKDEIDHTDEMINRSNRHSIMKSIVRILISIVLQFWILCSTCVLILLLVYWTYGGFITLIALHFAVLGLLYNYQDLLLYFPDQPPQARVFVDMPSAYGLPCEIITIKTSDSVPICLYLIKQPQHIIHNAPTVIYFHGNAGNIGHRLMDARFLYTVCKVNIALVEYRGYGRSRGKPSEQGLYLDAQAAVQHIMSRTDINQGKLILFGRSLGGAVAVHAATIPAFANCISGLIVENTFTSIPDMALSIFKLSVLNYLPEWCYKNKFQTKKIIGKTSVPTLFISGLKDELVPPSMMIQLYDSSGSSLKRIAMVEHGTHNETWQAAGYHEMQCQFLHELEQFKQGVRIPSSGIYPVPYHPGGGL